MVKILLVGPIYSGRKRDIGGTTVLMQFFLDYLKNTKASFYFIRSNKYNNRILNFFYMNFLFLKKVKNFDLIIGNGSANFVKYISPFLIIYCKIFKKKYILRLFGGDIDLQIKQAKIWNKVLIYFSLNKSSVVFFETRVIIQYFKDNYSNIKNINWFPNCRNKKKNEEKKIFNNKFIFLSQIKKEKGINTIIRANKKLDKLGKSIDIYGPIFDSSLKLGKYYKGVIEPKKVLNVLESYSILILPTYYSGEGYPGIILEAFSLGLPVISTNFRAIPELIDDGVNGWLIDKENHDHLIEKIIFFNQDNYTKMSKNAILKFNRLFDSNVVHRNIINKIMSINYGNLT